MILFRLTRRRVTIAVATVLVVFGLLFVGVSWYYSGLIEDGGFKVDREADELDLEIVSVADGKISFKHPSGDGRWVQSGL